MNKEILNLIFRKPGPQFNSIENVFNAMTEYFRDEFDLREIYLPFRTQGVKSMRENLRFIQRKDFQGICHLTGHDNYILKTLGERSVLTVHDINSAFSGDILRDFFIKKKWFQGPIKKAKVITVISEFSKKELLESFPYASSKVHTIPNPVDSRFSLHDKKFNKDKPVILHVGTKANKNLERVIRALKGIDCQLQIIGILKQDQSGLLQKEGIDYINYSNLSFEGVVDCYKQADILLFPSLYEGFGMPILEAQATGRAVITSNAAAMPATAGEGALLVNPREAGEIREAVLKLIDDDHLRTSLVDSGLENVKKYAASNIAAKYIKLYKNFN